MRTVLRGSRPIPRKVAAFARTSLRFHVRFDAPLLRPQCYNTPVNLDGHEQRGAMSLTARTRLGLNDSTAPSFASVAAAMSLVGNRMWRLAVAVAVGLQRLLPDPGTCSQANARNHWPLNSITSISQGLAGSPTVTACLRPLLISETRLGFVSRVDVEHRPQSTHRRLGAASMVRL